MAKATLRSNFKTIDGARRFCQRLTSRITSALGTMSTQDADSVAITGGTIAGCDIDVSANTLTLADDQIDVDKIGTTELSTAQVLAPDGAGGVEWSAQDATQVSNWPTFLALVGVGGI